jgi:hypothetical protein
VEVLIVLADDLETEPVVQAWRGIAFDYLQLAG